MPLLCGLLHKRVHHLVFKCVTGSLREPQSKRDRVGLGPPLPPPFGRKVRWAISKMPRGENQWANRGARFLFCCRRVCAFGPRKSLGRGWGGGREGQWRYIIVSAARDTLRPQIHHRRGCGLPVDTGELEGGWGAARRGEKEREYEHDMIFMQK